MSTVPTFNGSIYQTKKPILGNFPDARTHFAHPTMFSDSVSWCGATYGSSFVVCSTRNPVTSWASNVYLDGANWLATTVVNGRLNICINSNLEEEETRRCEFWNLLRLAWINACWTAIVITSYPFLLAMGVTYGEHVYLSEDILENSFFTIRPTVLLYYKNGPVSDLFTLSFEPWVILKVQANNCAALFMCRVHKSKPNCV